jgi:4a-hydroxytetrahydrobiopterin dehydratase
MEKCTDARVDEALATLPEWSRMDEKWMVRKYRFASFREAIDFVNAVADIAEEMNHHPMIAIDFKMVTIRMTSWKAQGISELDLEQAARLEKIFAQK